MMGQYLLYCQNKLVGGIYDNRLLLKPVKSAIDYMTKPTYALPYPGAKEMLLVEDVDNKGYLEDLLKAMLSDLPAPKRKHR